MCVLCLGECNMRTDVEDLSSLVSAVEEEG